MLKSSEQSPPFRLSNQNFVHISHLPLYWKFPVPNLMSIFHYFGHSEVLSICLTPKLETMLYQPFMTAYSIYLQLPSISEGPSLRPQPEDVLCHSNKGSTNSKLCNMIKKYNIAICM
jgi:hypothetical protein